MGNAPAFADAVQTWYVRQRRNLPWRETRDPYRIWISEIMLQQTRASTVIPYYQAFLKRFPTVEALARAPESAVLSSWSGLGYYSRARNLRKAARWIVENGQFPADYQRLRQLPGVGPYTAAAISSIAFGLPHAVLDGNVARVMTRLTADFSDIGVASTKARLQLVADSLLDHKHAGRFNQAVMELGATVCLPRAPLCEGCPVSRYCEARRKGIETELPVKLRRGASVAIESTLLVVERRGKICLWRRGADSQRLAGFWELPSPKELAGVKIGHNLGVFRHTITNNKYTFTVVSGRVTRVAEHFRWFDRQQISRIPLSTTARKALNLYFPDVIR
jgi:A/G-specific adenine glycosylase